MYVAIGPSKVSHCQSPLLPHLSRKLIADGRILSVVSMGSFAWGVIFNSCCIHDLSLCKSEIGRFGRGL
jgi:hypothetical protein